MNYSLEKQNNSIFKLRFAIMRFLGHIFFIFSQKIENFFSIFREVLFLICPKKVIYNDFKSDLW